MTQTVRAVLDHRIKDARRRVSAANSEFRRTLREVQDSCNHQFAVQRNWSTGVLARHDAIRICLACGYEEHSPYGDGNGHWPNGGLTAIGYGGTIKSFERTFLRKSKFPRDCIVMPVQDDVIVRYRPTRGL